MSSNLYNEAIVDAKQLIQMAEENAKNKLIDAVAPRIRKLVESQLLGEAEGEDEDFDMLMQDTGDDSEESETEDSEEAAPEMDAGEEASSEMGSDDDIFNDIVGEEDYDDEEEYEDEEEESGFDDFEDGVFKLPKNVKKVTFDIGESDKMLTDKGAPVELTKEGIQTLTRIVDGKGSVSDRLKQARFDLKVIGRALGALNEGRIKESVSLQIVEDFNSVLRRAVGLRAEAQGLVEGPAKRAALVQVQTLIKEISDMTTRSLLRTLLEGEAKKTETAKNKAEAAKAKKMKEADKLKKEADAAKKEATKKMKESDKKKAEAKKIAEARARIARIMREAEGDEAEAGDEAGGEVDVEAVKSALQSLATAVGMEVAAAEEGGDDAAAEETTEGDEMEEVYELNMEADEMDEAEDMDEMEEMDEADEMDEGEEEEEVKKESRNRRDQTVFQIDESMLRRSLVRMRRLRESVEDSYGHFGGGEDDGDYFEDPPELNALSEKDEPKKEAKKAKAEAAKAQKEADDAKKEAVKEARINRVLRSRVDEASKAVKTLNRQLAEQHLFNAKLLYVNKLMQNRSLSDKQLRAIVEALDSAQSLREAKLLFTSLSESLSRSAGSLSEGTNRTVGSSSRSTRPGGVINESVEVDRWAVLAGIRSDKA